MGDGGGMEEESDLLDSRNQRRQHVYCGQVQFRVGIGVVVLA